MPPPRLASAPRDIRILQMIPTLTVGGAERVAALLARHLHRSGTTVGLVSLYGSFGTWLEAELRADGVPLFLLGKRPGLDLRMFPRVARVIAGFRPTVVHTHMYALQYAYPTLVAGRYPVVHTLHNMAEREAHRPGRLLQQLAFRTGVVPVAIGDAAAASIRRVYRLSPRHVIPNGIPVAKYAAPDGAREAVRASLRIPVDAPTFVVVGRLEEQKDHRTLLRAFASERLSGLRAHLLVAGDGPLRAELEGQGRELRVAERLRFLGVRDDIPGVLAAADIFVLSSAYEGNPLTIMEAMAARKPVIASAVGCVPELVIQGAGRLVPPGDDAALEAAMFELAARPSLAREAGESGGRVASARFDVSVMARAYEALYEEIAR